MSDGCKLYRQYIYSPVFLSEYVGSLRSAMTRVGKIEHVVQRNFNEELTIVAINAPRFANEEPMQLAKQIVDATGSNSDCVVNAMHTAPLGHNCKGVFKIEMASQADKKVVLQHKKNLKNSSQFNKVYLRSSQTHAERLIHLNFRKLLEELPNGNEFRMTGNGRLIKQSTDNTHQKKSVNMKDYMDHSGKGNSSDSQTSVKVNYSTKPGPLDMSVKPKSYAQVDRVSQPINQGNTFNQTLSQVPPTQNQNSQDMSQSQLILQPQSHIQGGYAYTNPDGSLLQTYTTDQTFGQDLLNGQGSQAIMTH